MSSSLTYIEEQASKVIKRQKSELVDSITAITNIILKEIWLSPFDEIIEFLYQDIRICFELEDSITDFIGYLNKLFIHEGVEFSQGFAEEIICIKFSSQLMSPLTQRITPEEIEKLPLFKRRIVLMRHKEIEAFFANIIDRINEGITKECSIITIEIFHSLFATEYARQYLEEFLAKIDMTIMFMKDSCLVVTFKDRMV